MVIIVMFMTTKVAEIITAKVIIYRLTFLLISKKYIYSFRCLATLYLRDYFSI